MDQGADRLAVLIDADNAQAALAAELLAEIGRYGSATVRRAYGDWTTTNLAGWKNRLHALAIQPMQQFRLTTGKNATDSALIIDAMDLLHGGSVDGFCLVSSDSDFTRLATRIRESGKIVYGFGEKETPKPFVAACNKFVFTEILKGPEPQAATQRFDQEPLKPLLLTAISDAAGDEGWALLGHVGNLINRSNPEFDSRIYGYKKLSELMKAQHYLETRSDPPAEGGASQRIFVKIKGS